MKSAPHCKSVLGAGAGRRFEQVRWQPGAIALDVTQARAALCAAWLVADNHSPSELVRRLPASARAESIEHERELESFLRAIRLEIEEGAEL